MHPKILLFWIITITALVLAGCSVPPTQSIVVPTIGVPTPTVVQDTVVPTELPTSIPTEPVKPTFTVSAPTLEPTANTQTSTGQGDQILQSVCTVCHSSDRIVNSHKTQAEWETTVNRMISHGAVLSDSDKVILLLYLSETYK